MFQKSVGKFWISHQKFLITLYIFCSPSVIPSESAHGQRCITTRPMEFTPVVGDSVGKYRLPTHADRLYPSVSTSVIVAFPVNTFATLCEMPMDGFYRYRCQW